MGERGVALILGPAGADLHGHGDVRGFISTPIASPVKGCVGLIEVTDRTAGPLTC